MGKEELRFKNIVKFKKVKGNKLPDLSPEVVKNLNQDQQVLYHFTKAATTGPEYFVEHPKLRTIAPGHMHNARWITHANWVFRLYFSTEKPCKDLVKLVKFLT